MRLMRPAGPLARREATALPASIDASTPEEFFHSAAAAFEHACASGAEAQRCLRLGGVSIRLRFASPAVIEPTIRPLQHLAVPPVDAPDFTICVWDERSTGIAAPPPPWRLDAYGRRSEIAGYNTNSVHTAYHVDTDSLCLFDRARRCALSWTRDVTSLPSYELAAPLRTILHWTLRERGLQMIHAGAVGTRTGGALLVGPGGSGKSSTALGCLGSPLAYLSDDYCALSVDPEPRVYGVYSSGKLHDADLGPLAFLAEHVAHRDPHGREKSIFFLHDSAPEAIIGSFPLRAVCIMHRTTARESALQPASPAAGLLALAPSTHAQLPNAGAELLQRVAAAVKRTPCFHLHLGTDRAQIPRLIARALAG